MPKLSAQGEIVVIGGVSTNEGTDDIKRHCSVIFLYEQVVQETTRLKTNTIVGIYCAASDLTYSVTLSPEVARKAIRAAYQVKLIDDDVSLWPNNRPTTIPDKLYHELLEAKNSTPSTCRILGKLYQLKVIFKEHDINPDAVRKLPKDFIIRNQVIPLDLDNNVLHLAVATPRKRPYRSKCTNGEVRYCHVSGAHSTYCMALQANTIVNAIDAPHEEDKPKKPQRKGPKRQTTMNY